MDILKCVNVSKVYGTGENRVVALDHVDTAIEKGSFTAVVGASGSGKSTLLHLLGGVDKPTEGQILVEDTDIAALNAAKMAVFRRRKLGIVYQFYNLIPTLNVKKNIELPMLLDKRRPDPEFFADITEMLGLSEKLTAMPSQLSGGQQQRTAIARSLIYRPAILLADEPTGNLDQKNAREIVELLKLFNRNLKQTIVLVTHDERMALEADRIITVEDGKILSDMRR